MRKIILFMHTTLDGFTAGLNGEMDWIKLNDEMFDYAAKRTEEADTALYGRVTYQMMQSYWPTAGDQPKATKHDIEHSTWYNKVEKVVLSKTMKGQYLDKTTIISDNAVEEINKLKNKPGKNILIFGSPSASHLLMQHNLIDEYWLFVNPVILVQGIPLFKDISHSIQLKLVENINFDCGVAGLHYVKQ